MGDHLALSLRWYLSSFSVQRYARTHIWLYLYSKALTFVSALDAQGNTVMYRKWCRKQHWLSSSKSRSIWQHILLHIWWNLNIKYVFWSVHLYWVLCIAKMGSALCKMAIHIQVTIQIMLWYRFFFLPNDDKWIWGQKIIWSSSRLHKRRHANTNANAHAYTNTNSGQLKNFRGYPNRKVAFFRK